MLSEEVVVARSASGQAAAIVAQQLALGVDLLDDRLDDHVAVGEVVGSRRDLAGADGSAPSILAQAATTFSSARQAEASLRASRITSAVVVATAASP